MKTEDNLMTQFFKKQDIFVYAVLLAVIVTVTVVFLPARENPVTSFEVYCDNQLIFTYDVQNKAYNVFSDKCSIEQSFDGIILTIIQSDGQKNIAVFNEKGAKMLESNCSNTKECVNNFPYLNNSGAIICVPNHIKIVAITQNGDIIVPSGKI